MYTPREMIKIKKQIDKIKNDQHDKENKKIKKYENKKIRK